MTHGLCQDFCCFFGYKLDTSNLWRADKTQGGNALSDATRGEKKNAGKRSRTADTRIFSPLLYHLSYPGTEDGDVRARSFRARGLCSVCSSHWELPRSGIHHGSRLEVPVHTGRRMALLGRRWLLLGSKAIKSRDDISRDFCGGARGVICFRIEVREAVRRKELPCKFLGRRGSDFWLGGLKLMRGLRQPPMAKNSMRTCLARGAAVSPPVSPSSTRTTTTIRGSSHGA